MSHEYASWSCWSSTASSTPTVSHVILQNKQIRFDALLAASRGRNHVSNKRHAFGAQPISMEALWDMRPPKKTNPSTKPAGPCFKGTSVKSPPNAQKPVMKINGFCWPLINDSGAEWWTKTLLPILSLSLSISLRSLLPSQAPTAAMNVTLERDRFHARSYEREYINKSANCYLKTMICFWFYASSFHRTWCWEQGTVHDLGFVTCEFPTFHFLCMGGLECQRPLSTSLLDSAGGSISLVLDLC